MNIRVPETNKKPGICYAVTDDGIELPFIDITHPSFTLDIREEKVTQLRDELIRDQQRRARYPQIVQRALMYLFMRRSVLGRAFMDAQDGFLHSLPTYMLKLGPDHLGRGYSQRMDRRIAASGACVAVRLRLQDVARLVAEGMTPALRAKPGRPVNLVNIAGGPAADSLNALILIHKEHPELLAGRRIAIRVLDLHSPGPNFGRRVLDVLLAPGAPLHGVDVAFEHIPYNWAGTGELQRLLKSKDLQEAVIAVSSEGGLFDYGSDEEIIANLSVLRAGTPPDTVVAGSVTRADGLPQITNSAYRIAVRPRTLEEFRKLTERAAWSIGRVIEGPFSRQVRLAASADS